MPDTVASALSAGSLGAFALPDGLVALGPAVIRACLAPVFRFAGVREEQGSV